MSNQPPTVLERAKQGDASAIAALLNRSLQPKGITANTEFENGCLKIRLESTKGVSHPALVDYIRNGVIKLELDSVRIIQLSSYQTGNPVPLWEESIDMSPYLGVPDLSLPDDEPTPAEPLPSEEPIALESVPSETTPSPGDISTLEPTAEPAIDHQPKPTPFKKYWTALIALVVVIPLGFLAWYFLAPKEEPIATQDNSSVSQSTPSPTAPQPTDAYPVAQSPVPVNPDETVKQAYNAAMDAAVKTQTATTRSDWQQVVTSWQSAIQLLGQVPADHPLYNTAQQKIGEYQRNLSYAQSKETQAE